MKRLKKAVVDSFVGAIALGYLLAQGIVHFANTFSAPIASWILRKEYAGFPGFPALPGNLMVRDALPELARSVAILAL